MNDPLDKYPALKARSERIGPNRRRRPKKPKKTIMEIFEEAFAVIIDHEGGFVDNPIDHGGPTNWGITYKTLKAWKGDLPVKYEDIENLTLQDAKLIYRDLFWFPNKLHKIIKPVVSTILFDQIINVGANRAITRMQLCLKEVFECKLSVDGVMGQETLDAINTLRREDTSLCLEFFKRTQAHYAKLVIGDPTQRTFLLGWLARTHSLLDYVLSMSKMRISVGEH